MLPDWTIIGFTGHRKLANASVVRSAIVATLDQLAARGGAMAAVASAASGSDTLFLEEADRRSLPFFLVLPFPREKFREDFNDAEWERVQPLFRKALNIAELERTETKEEAYLETSRQTVDRADVLIAVLDANHAHGKGGARDAVEYADALGKTVFLIDPNTGAIQPRRMSALPPALPAGAAQMTGGDAKQEVKKHFDEVNARAQAHGPQARQMVRWIILLHLLSTALAIGAMVFQPLVGTGAVGHAVEYVAAALELVCLGAALYLIYQHHQLHEDWLTSRIAAELCRSARTTWGLRHHAEINLRVAIPGFERLSVSLQMARYLDRSPVQSVNDVCREYREERVRHQIEYFKNEAGAATTQYRWRRRLATAATVGAILFNVGASALIIFGVVHGQEAIYLTIKLVALLLPLVNATMFTLIVSQDYSRRVVRYPEMAAVLAEMEKRLSGEMTWPSLARVMNETEQLLLQEVVEWYSFTRFAGASH
jgi:nucleoside 2-deoxyribosyltransferase